MPADWPLLALGAAVGGFVQGLTGFAFGMVAMSFWVWGIEPRVAAVMVVFGGVVGQVLSALSLRRAPRWAWLLPLLLGARVHLGLSDLAFRRAVLALLTAAGVAMLAATRPQLQGL